MTQIDPRTGEPVGIPWRGSSNEPEGTETVGFIHTRGPKEGQPITAEEQGR